MASRSSASKLSPGTLADRADKHALYQAAVNAPDDNIDFIERVYREARGRDPRILKEDFCGTALMAVEWAKRGAQRRAIGVDLDPEPLAWGARHNVAPAGPAVARRVRLIEGDVTAESDARADIVCALNFSYFLLTTRKQLVAYFRNARRSLRPQGLFVLDCIGGTEAIADFTEERAVDDFIYIWRQQDFNPIDHTSRCSINFAFADGSSLEPAFDYTWRMWTMPEIRDCLEEAGFGQPRVFWEYTDDQGEADYQEISREQNQEIWLAYLVASL